MGNRLAALALAALAATPAGAQELVCDIETLCEDGECRPLGVAMPAGIDGGMAWIGPPGDRLELAEVPVAFRSQRLFAASDGERGDAVVLALHDDGRLVMFQSPTFPEILYAVIVGQCRDGG
jgi:hypothetical protein